MSQDDKRHHLQMIQDVIKRMAETSAAMKRYALVSFAATAVMVRILEMPAVLLLAGGLVIFFWMLDAQYLRQEQWFQDMYDQVRGKNPGDVDFDMSPGDDIRNATSIWYGLNNWSTRWLYGPLLVTTVLLWLSFGGIITTGGG